MDSEERLLIENLVDKMLTEKEEDLEKVNKEPETFNPVTKPWRAYMLSTGQGPGPSLSSKVFSGPSSQELRDLIWKKE